MRGKIVLNEDFIKVNETHPKNQSPPPKIACKTQLNESRKEKDKETGKEFEIRRGYQFRYNLPLNEIISTDSFSNDPKYKTIQDRKDFERGLARTGMGLLNEIEAPKVGFSYTADPKNRTRSHMRGRRKEEMVDVLNKTANYGHIGESERMRIREENNALISYRDELPKQKILERKIMDTHQLGEKFSKTTVGVHGCELPRYAENSREYWKMDEKSQSCENSFLQTSKSFKAAQEHERFENDAFKQHYHVNKHIKDIPLEPNKIVHSTSISNNPNARNSRWTTYNDNFYDRRASPVAETSFITDKKHAQKARTTISKFRGTHTSITNRMGQRGSQSPIRQTLRSAGFL